MTRHRQLVTIYGRPAGQAGPTLIGLGECSDQQLLGTIRQLGLTHLYLAHQVSPDGPGYVIMRTKGLGQARAIAACLSGLGASIRLHDNRYTALQET